MKHSEYLPESTMKVELVNGNIEITKAISTLIDLLLASVYQFSHLFLPFLLLEV